MLKLNIISQELKKEIELKNNYLKLKNIITYLVIFIFICSSFLIIGEYIINSYAKELSSRTISISPEAENYYSNIENINKQITYVKDIQKENVKWTNFLEIFSKTIEPGIILSNIEINQDNQSLSIQGIATERQDLLNLQNNLEKTNLFTQIIIPIDKLTQKKEINFDLKTTFKSYEF